MLSSSRLAVSNPVVIERPGQGHPLPFVVQAEPGSADIPLEELLAWLTETTPQREEQLHRSGAILLRGFRAVKDAETFAEVVQRMAPQILDYAGGTTPRSAVSGKIVTSTDAPAHMVIGQHQEMSYLAPSAEFPDPTPDKVMFFCQIAPGGGGQTPITDMRTVYKKLPPELVERFVQKGGLIFQRRLPSEKKYGFEVTWPTAFGTDDRKQMEKIAAQRGWKVAWTGQGALEVTHPPSPVVKTHRVTGETIWFNQAHLLHKSVAPWRSAWLGPSLTQKLRARLMQPFIQDRFFYHSTHADGSEISLQDLETIRRVVEQETVMFDWQAGDVILIDNKLVAHGRRPYEPPRKVLAALLADTPRKSMLPDAGKN
ncbi:MAG: TauD/TfdA family dioxygenase [Acidobacteria bacterium]|nr:TauD/TfdA family dioxygenase [Acidobacteriota bacterium]